MNTNTDFDKIDKVFSKITGKELKRFVRLFSYTHDDFATALVEKYWNLMSEEIKRLALLKEKPKEFAWLLGEVRHVMGHSHIADEVIKDGIKKMIAEYPDKYYVKNYLGSVL